MGVMIEIRVGGVLQHKVNYDEETKDQRETRWLTDDEVLILPEWMGIHYRSIRDKHLSGRGAHSIEETFDIELISEIYEYLRNQSEEMQRRFRILNEERLNSIKEEKMSRVKRWLNKYTTIPVDVKPGDGFAIKVVGVAYDNCWAVYFGRASWSDEKVASQGDAIHNADLAKGLFPVLALCGLPYDVL